VSRFGKGRLRTGNAIIELTLLMPWIFFLFVGALDFGFYTHALISVQNATRVAALYTGQAAAVAGSQPDACRLARGELSKMPNASSFATGCDSGPLVVTATSFTDSEGQLGSRVQIAYQTLPMIPIPGLLTGSITISRIAEVRVVGG